MSEQIREQVSAFLDGELPDSETELLLKRLIRDAELRQNFGRYSLIGEAMRGTSGSYLSSKFLGRVNGALDAELPVVAPLVAPLRAARWWRPLAGAAVAAGVAAIAIVALQQRAAAPNLAAATLPTATGVEVAPENIVREPVSYTTPVLASGGGVGAAPAGYPAARLTKYVFAHSRYSSVLGQSNVISGLLTDADEQEAAAVGRGAGGATPDLRKSP